MMFCNAKSTNRAPGVGRRAIALVVWLAGMALAEATVADHVFGPDHPHTHDHVGESTYASPYMERRLRESADGQRILELRAHLETHPSSASVAAELARAYLARFRYEGDPGLLVLAKDVLAAWEDDVDPPVPVALEKAVLWQTEHRFAAALEMLERLVQREPRNARAWLTIAGVSKELGLHAKSRRACGQLLWLSDPLLGGACMASVLTATGLADDAYSMLQSLARQRTDDLDVGVVTWMHSLAAEAAVAMNRPDLAETHFLAALDAAEHEERLPEIYLLVEYADFLVVQNRSEDVLDLLRHAPRAPSIMIREADARESATF